MHSTANTCTDNFAAEHCTSISNNTLQDDNVVRNQVNHLQNPPGHSSHYVTWTATFHPEKAHETIDHKYKEGDKHSFSIIYEEVKEDIPFAVAIPISDDNGHDIQVDSEGDVSKNTDCEKIKIPPTKCSSTGSDKCFSLFSAGMLIGSIIAFTTILSVVICETVAMGFHWSGVFIYRATKILHQGDELLIHSNNNGIAVVFYYFLMIFYYSFTMVDSIILVTSVLLTEALAFTTWVLTIPFFFGYSEMSNQWHQYIRRICHHIRWAFRSTRQEPPFGPMYADQPTEIMKEIVEETNSLSSDRTVTPSAPDINGINGINGINEMNDIDLEDEKWKHAI